MARNGSGTMALAEPAFVFDTVIDEAAVNSDLSDIAAEITNSVAVDGQSTMSGALKMGSQKITGLAVGTLLGDAATLRQVQAEAFIWCGTATGTADAIVLTPAPAIAAYAAGQRFVWMASASANTGATTVAISGLSAIALQDGGAALVAAEHAANKMFMGILNTTSTMQIMQVRVADATDSTNVLAALVGQEAVATGFTGTLDGVLGGGTPAAASVTTLTLTTDLAVAHGGTGASTHTANSVLIGNGASAITSVAPSTSGNVLTSNGSAWTSAAAGGGGLIVQIVHVEDGTLHSGTTAIPTDNTIPQKTEGDEVFTLAITPTSASNKLMIEVNLTGFTSAAVTTIIGALFQDTTANALASVACGTGGAGTSGQGNHVFLRHYMAAGTTSATTFKVRVGGASGSTFVNSYSAGQVAIMGGTLASNITITEIAV